MLQIEPNIVRISFFSRCTTLNCSNISFSIYQFNYLHQNLTVIILKNYSIGHSNLFSLILYCFDIVLYKQLSIIAVHQAQRSNADDNGIATGL